MIETSVLCLWCVRMMRGDEEKKRSRDVDEALY